MLPVLVRFWPGNVLLELVQSSSHVLLNTTIITIMKETNHWKVLHL